MTNVMIYVSAGQSTARLTTNVDAPEIIGDYYAPSDIYAAELRNDATDGTVTIYSGRAMGAARLSLRGKSWSEDDRVECAGHLAAYLTAERSNLTGTPRDVLAYIDWCEAHPLTARMRETAIPARAATMTRLMGLAANWRRAEERRRATEHRAHHERVTLTGLVTVQGAQAETVDTRSAERMTLDIMRRSVVHAQHAIRRLPSRAERVSAYIDTAMSACENVQDAELDRHHVKARDLLGGLGLPRLGRAYVAAYCASAMPGAENRGVSNDERAETAAEIARTLGYDPATSTLRSALNRSRKFIPSAETHDYIAHADILGVTEETYTGKPHASKTEHADRTHIRSAEVAGVTVECACETAPLACPVHPLTKREIHEGLIAPSTRVARWTETLSDSTRDRLSTASDIRDARR